MRLFHALIHRLFPTRTSSLGQRGEDLAARWLKRQGYRILGTRIRETTGELDLIARLGPTYVFVEVKTRSHSEHGEPWEAVNKAKQRQVVRAAVRYLQRRKIKEVPIRFDVIGITWPPEESVQPTITHFTDAFSADPRWLV